MSNDQITGLKLHDWGVLSPIFFSSKFELIDLLLLCIFNGLLIFLGFKKYLSELENTPAEIIDKSRLDECLREKNKFRLELQRQRLDELQRQRLELRRRYIDNILNHPLVEQIKERKFKRTLLSDKYSKEELEKLENSCNCSIEEFKRIQNALSKKLKNLKTSLR